MRPLTDAISTIDRLFGEEQLGDCIVDSNSVDVTLVLLRLGHHGWLVAVAVDGDGVVGACLLLYGVLSVGGDVAH